MQQERWPSVLEPAGGPVRLGGDTLTGQSALAYRLAAGMLFVGVLISVVDILLAGDLCVTGFSVLIDVALGIGLIQLRPGARTWTLIRAALGAIVWPIIMFLTGDPVAAVVGTVIQWGACGSLILVLTGESKVWRLALAVGIYVIFALVPYAALLLLIGLAVALGEVPSSGV